MSARVIDNKRDRLTTILVAPLTTCSARIPVYTLIISAFIPNRIVWGFANLQGLVMFGLYAAGIVSALIVAFVIRKVIWRGASEPFLIELPAYKLPDPGECGARRAAARPDLPTPRGHHHPSMMVLIWFLSSFPAAPANARPDRPSTTAWPA